MSLKLDSVRYGFDRFLDVYSAFIILHNVIFYRSSIIGIMLEVIRAKIPPLFKATEKYIWSLVR